MKKITLLLITILYSATIKAQDVSTLAGSTGGFLNATGSSAKFNNPRGICNDGAGNLYISDTYNHKIRKIVIATGEVSTLAGSTPGFLNGTGTSTKFYNPEGICSDGTNLYVADAANEKIRKIVIATGEVSTLAGSTNGYTNAIGTLAKFRYPNGLCYDGTGNLYVADYGNNKIRKIAIATGEVSTLAGSIAGYANGTGTSAKFTNPSDLCIDGAGNLYIADTYNHRIRKIVIATGEVSNLAGEHQGFYNSSGNWAQFDTPMGIYSDGTDNLYIADTNNHKIRKIAITTGTTSTLAGSTAGYTNAIGTSARFSSPNRLCFDAKGHLYVIDSFNNKIRKISNVVLSIQKNNFNTKLSIYPNPSIGVSTIQLGASYTNVNVQITDILGKQIHSFKQYNTTEIVLKTQKMIAGIYIVNIQSGTKQASLKLVVK